MSVALKQGQARRRAMTKYPVEYEKKVDITKVNLGLMKSWITTEIAKILGNDDDVPIELAFGHLERAKDHYASKNSPDIKQLQDELGPFLEKKTETFCKQLWNLCLSAQNSPEGVPKELLEAKKTELLKEREYDQKAKEAARRRETREDDRAHEADRIRKIERDQRREGRRSDNYRRRSPPLRDSRSPDGRRDSRRSYRPFRTSTDSYAPRKPARREGRSRSPNPRSRRSSSPPSSSGRRGPAGQHRRSDGARQEQEASALSEGGSSGS